MVLKEISHSHPLYSNEVRQSPFPIFVGEDNQFYWYDEESANFVDFDCDGFSRAYQTLALALKGAHRYYEDVMSL